ncbi:MAG: undecaprenyl-diphosphate phosphatase [Solirubrobacteraceae bacterium]
MSVLESIVLGIVQGLSEFLPISSTAHLRIVPAMLGWEDPGAAFTAVTQLGTMAAVLIYFRADLWAVARAWMGSLWRPELRGSPEARMGWYLIAGTVPIVIFGVLFEKQIETGARDLYLIGTTLIVLGIVLFAADRVSRRDRDLEDLSTRDGVAIGFAQSLALVPGVSRSGATITAGLLLGLDRAAAARFSFLLSVPAVVLSGVYEGLKIARGTVSTDTSALSLILATGMAFVFGYASIAFLLRYLATHDLTPFVVYRVVVGALVLVLVASGAIS